MMFTYGINIRVDRGWWESLCTCLCFFNFETRGMCYLFTNEKGKRNPYLSGEETQKLKKSQENPWFLGLVIEGSLVSWCPLEPKYRVMKVRFWTSPGACYLMLQPCFPFCLWDKARPGFLRLPLIPLASRLSPERGSHSVMSESLQPSGL